MGKQGMGANRSYSGEGAWTTGHLPETPTRSRSRRSPGEASVRGEIGATRDNSISAEKRGKRESREGADARGPAATPGWTAPGEERAALPSSAAPVSRQDPLQPGCSSYLGIRGNARATAGRRVCFQPCSLTWRPTSCHTADSGLPRLWRIGHLQPSRPASLRAPLPAGRPTEEHRVRDRG